MGGRDIEVRWGEVAGRQRGSGHGAEHMRYSRILVATAYGVWSGGSAGRRICVGSKVGAGLGGWFGLKYGGGASGCAAGNGAIGWYATGTLGLRSQTESDSTL